MADLDSRVRVCVYIFDCNISSYRIECTIGNLFDFSVNIHPIH